jgi:hypothetical protein
MLTAAIPVCFCDLSEMIPSQMRKQCKLRFGCVTICGSSHHFYPAGEQAVGGVALQLVTLAWCHSTNAVQRLTRSSPLFTARSRPLRGLKWQSCRPQFKRQCVAGRAADVVKCWLQAAEPWPPPSSWGHPSTHSPTLARNYNSRQQQIELN